MSQRCPYCGSLVPVKHIERKSEKIIIRCTPSTKRKWIDTMNDTKKITNYEELLLHLLSLRHMSLDVSIRD